MKTGYASRVMMVWPKGFGFNPQTAASNVFQHKPEMDNDVIRSLVNAEFSAAVKTIRQAGIDVVIFEEPSGTANPDALYPNNWFSSQPDGSVVIYPMATENRRKERHINWIDSLMQNEMIPDAALLDLSHNEEIGKYLEGTGSIVFDHLNKIAFAALSERTDKSLFDELCQLLNYEGFSFKTKDENGMAIYHTNVLLSCCPDWAIFCPDVIIGNETVIEIEKKLRTNSRSVLKIKSSQMHRFAANSIGLISLQGEKLILMSKNAFTSLDIDQQSWITEIAKPVLVNIPTIENIGGGGIRCMIAELFN